MGPDFLVVVDDSDRRHREVNRHIVYDVRLPRTRYKYLENDRTPGASGAWNVALDWLHRQVASPEGIFIAILDDDDRWEPDYLESCLEATTERHLDMVAGDLVRHSTPSDQGVLNPAPDELSADDFLVGNYGIQGSNLFVRLATLLAAGLFDEALASATDRDLCIRIADLDGVRYGRLPRALVHHHADAGRPRLSTPGSAAKIDGLTRFWRKYRGRMSEDQRRAFGERASNLFGWCEPTAADAVVTAAASAPRDDQQPATPISLVVGMTVSSELSVNLDPLLRQLSDLRGDEGGGGLDLVILENGPRPTDTLESLDGFVAGLRTRDIACFLVPLEQQIADAERGLFGRPFVRSTGRESIATTRTMLQTYVYQLARRRTGAVVWILDEDMRLDNLVWRGGPTAVREALDLVGPLRRLKKTDVDVAIGTVTEAPPLPFASCMRTQLVDAYHNLEWFAALGPDARVPDRMAENMAERARCDDYYYDLSRRETDQLESPFWYVPANPGCTVRQALAEMVERLPRVLAGEQVFRPLILDAAVDPVEHMKPSSHRGGNTFVFDIEALREFPNAVPVFGGQKTRRSDMVWSLLNRFAAGRKVVKVPLAVRQDRSEETAGVLDLDKLCRDIQGYALYSALEDLLSRRLAERRQAGQPGPPDFLSLTDEDVAYAIGRFRKFLDERTAAFELSFYRAAGLARALGRYVDPRHAGRYWWIEDERCADLRARLERFVGTLRSEYDVSRLAEFRRAVNDVPDADVRQYIEDLRAEVAARRGGESPTRDDTAWIDRERALNATAWVEREFGAKGLRQLGSGAEGVVLTDGVTVFKCIDYWKSRMPAARLDFLRTQIGRWNGLRGLYPLLSVSARGSWAILTYPYEPSQPYRGGYGEGLLQLLRDCRQAGIVCTNVHPDNLVVADGVVKLVDYGADIRPYSDDGFRRMARRAYLAWKHPGRPDLKELLRRSIKDEAMPELGGFERFWTAIDPPGKEVLVDARMEEIVALLPPGRLLDYGCGKGKFAVAMARRGWDVVAYDPDPTLVPGWSRSDARVRFFGADGLHGLESDIGRFDVVICSLVLCILDDEPLGKVVADLHRFVRPGGHVIIVVCNPRFVGVHTTLQRRELPPNWRPDSTFEYSKVMRSTGARRRDIHRPESLLRTLLRHAGLEVESAEETPGVDVERFEYASDFLILRCRPAARRARSGS